MKNNQALTMYPLFFDPIYKKAEMKKIDGKDCICYQEDFWEPRLRRMEVLPLQWKHQKQRR